jgi:tetratricopeptide (TPR) repeat protein
MAPEQAACRHGDVGIQTDVYGLGVILYELLTGHPPHTGESDVETLHRIMEEPAPMAPLDQRRVPRDLQTVCLKCLQKDLSERYETAGALATDLQRFLAGEPIAARPVGRAERLALWCKRRPLQAALCAALWLVTVGGVGGIVWQWQRAEKNLTLARTESSRAEESLRQVELSFIDLAWVFEEVELWSGSDNTFPTLMADKLQHYANDMLPQYVASAKAPQPILAALYAMNAKNFSQTNQPQAAEEYYRRSIDLWREVLRLQPESAEYSRALAITLFGYTDHLLKSGAIKYDEHNSNVVQLVFASLKLLPDEEIRAMKSYAHMISNLGEARIRRRRIPEALAAFEQGRQAWHELGQRSRDLSFQAMEATMLSKLAASQNRFLHQRGFALNNVRRSREIMEAVVSQAPNQGNYKLLLAGALRNEANLTYGIKKPVQAVPLYERALSIQEAWVRDHPLETTDREYYGKVCLELAQLLQEWKKADAALPYYQLAAEQWESLIPIGKLSRENEASLTMVQCRIGEQQNRMGHDLDAIAALRRSIELADKLIQSPRAPRKATTALIRSNIQLAAVLHRTGASTEAASCLRRAMTVLQHQLINRPDNHNFKQQLEDAKSKLAELEAAKDSTNAAGS